MAGKPSFKQDKFRKNRRQSNKPKKLEEFTARPLPRGAHFTVYDIQGNNIDPALVERIEKTIEKLVIESGVPALGIDVRRG